MKHLSPSQVTEAVQFLLKGKTGSSFIVESQGTFMGVGFATVFIKDSLHSSAGHRCGYVFTVDSNCNLPDQEFGSAINVHGGVTYDQSLGSYRILGFDCAHPGDSAEYWTASRVLAQAIHMLMQLALLLAESEAEA